MTTKTITAEDFAAHLKANGVDAQIAQGPNTTQVVIDHNGVWVRAFFAPCGSHSVTFIKRSEGYERVHLLTSVFEALGLPTGVLTS